MAEKVQFYLLDAKYKVVDNNLEIHLYGRTPKGDHIIIIDSRFKPYFYVIPKKGNDIKDKISKLKAEHDEGTTEVVEIKNTEKRLNGQEIEALQVFTKLPSDVPVLRNIIKDWEMVDSVREYDIPFIRRYLIDNNINPMLLYEAEGEFFARKARCSVFNSTKITSMGDETLINPKILAFDIETYNPKGSSINYEKYPIIMVSLYSKGVRKVITWKRFKTNEDYIEFVESESDLLARFKEIIEQERPDIIAGYYSDGFDLPYIAQRAEKYKIKLDLGMDYSELAITKREGSKARIHGLIHLDVFKVITRLFSLSLKTDYYDLSSVSNELLGEKKTEAEVAELYKVWDDEPENLGIYCEYNLQDSALAYKLAEKIMPNIVEMIKTVGLPMFDLTRMGFSQLVEWFLIKQAFLNNEIVPDKPGYHEVGERRLHTYKGAFVFEPTPGLYKDVVIFDFRSLYPTIISSHNISPEMMNCDCCHDKADKVPIDKKNYWFCKKKKGFLSSVIEDLINRRSRIKEMMKTSKSVLLDARQNNLKVLANAFYGYLGFFNARWYCFECAQAVAAFGRFYIHKVIDSAKEQGFNVLYSDTDSIFLSLEGKSQEKSKQFAEKINLSLPGIMELEYEGFYPAALFVSAKAGEYGAKKKYALIDTDKELHIKGFETVRKNWSLVAKETQEEVLEIILRDDDPKKALKYVRDVVDKLNNKKIPVEKVIINTQLQKELDSYASMSPHVAIAKRLKHQGYDVGPGTRIQYVVTEGKGKIGARARLPEEVKDNQYDPSYYIENQVIPAVERIFSVLGFTKDDLISHKDQSKLGSFLK